MSFAVQIKKNNQGNLQEVASFSVWQKVTLMDDTFAVTQIEPTLTILQTSESKVSAANLLIKKRNLDYKIYQLILINENGIEKEISLPHEIFFKFKPKTSADLPINTIKKIEYSLVQNFSKLLTNKVFYSDFSFRKNTNSTFEFYLLREDNTKLYKKTLQPFPIDPPDNNVNIVYHSLELKNLDCGFYKIDGEEYYYDQFQEIKTNQYIIKISI